MPGGDLPSRLKSELGSVVPVVGFDLMGFRNAW